jgi:hypothetical protein
MTRGTRLWGTAAMASDHSRARHPAHAPARRPSHPAPERRHEPQRPRRPGGDGIALLDVLAAQMHARGWSAYITTPAGRVASLFVQDPHDHPKCGDIIAAPDATGRWWYWFSWAERIAPAHAPAAAADAIISAFQRPTDDPEPPDLTASRRAPGRADMHLASRARHVRLQPGRYPPVNDAPSVLETISRDTVKHQPILFRQRSAENAHLTSGAGGVRTHDRRIMSPARQQVTSECLTWADTSWRRTATQMATGG